MTKAAALIEGGVLERLAQLLLELLDALLELPDALGELRELLDHAAGQPLAGGIGHTCDLLLERIDEAAPPGLEVLDRAVRPASELVAHLAHIRLDLGARPAREGLGIAADTSHEPFALPAEPLYGLADLCQRAADARSCHTIPSLTV